MRTINKSEQENFATMQAAFKAGDVCLMACMRKADKKEVLLICAVGREQDGDYSFTPFAEMIDGNPFEMYNSAMEIDDGKNVGISGSGSAGVQPGAVKSGHRPFVDTSGRLTEKSSRVPKLQR